MPGKPRSGTGTHRTLARVLCVPRSIAAYPTIRSASCLSRLDSGELFNLLSMLDFPFSSVRVKKLRETCCRASWNGASGCTGPSARVLCVPRTDISCPAMPSASYLSQLDSGNLFNLLSSLHLPFSSVGVRKFRERFAGQAGTGVGMHRTISTRSLRPAGQFVWCTGSSCNAFGELSVTAG